MMRHALAIISVLAVLPMSAQIWEPDGLRVPGDWNGWFNTHNMGGDFDLTKITDGLDRWKTKFEYIGYTGTVSFKFASGGSGGPWANQWGCQGFTLDAVNPVAFCNTSNNTASLTQNKHYTIVFKDSGYTTTSVSLMETSADPVDISGQTRITAPGVNPAINQAVTIEVTLSGTKSAEERVFLVYTTDGWSTRTAIELENILGTSGSATIPGQAESTTVNYYFATSTMDLEVVTATEEDFDIRSIATGGASSYSVAAAVFGCQDEMACNYNSDAAECEYADEGYDCDGNCLSDSDSDGVCDEFEMAGCTYPLADNYDESAMNDDGSCVFGAILYEYFLPGFNAGLAQMSEDINSGQFCGEGTVWLGHLQKCMPVPTCFADFDLDGNRGAEDLLQLLSTYGTLCPEILGCTDAEALNFVPYATENDGSCVFSSIFGCMDSAACNFNPFANYDDGSCVELVFGYDCDGNCVGIDANENGICDEEE